LVEHLPARRPQGERQVGVLVVGRGVAVVEPANGIEGAAPHQQAGARGVVGGPPAHELRRVGDGMTLAVDPGVAAGEHEAAGVVGAAEALWAMTTSYRSGGVLATSDSRQATVSSTLL